MASLDETLKKVIEVEPIESRIYSAAHENKITGEKIEELTADALRNNLITEAEAEKVLIANKARLEIISVDDFDRNDIKLGAGKNHENRQ